MEVRRLTDADAPALLAFLAPTEVRSIFLLGNARECGIDDRGGPRHGVWLGAFENSAMHGVLAWFRGPNSWVPACEGVAGLLVPALIEATSGRPSFVVGTPERVAEVVAHLPRAWPISKRHMDVLMVLRWKQFRKPADAEVSWLPRARASEAAALAESLNREWDLPVDPARLLAMSERLADGGRIAVRERDGVLLAMSCEAASTGRFVHIGATFCVATERRSGHAGACVAAVVEKGRSEGRASEGATLFTAQTNAGAIALYERLGFERDSAWEICFIEA